MRFLLTRVLPGLLLFTSAFAQQALLYESTAVPGATPSQFGGQALNSLGLSFQTAGVANFNTLLTGSSWDLVVIDAYNDIPVSGGQDWQDLQDYIDGGGRVVMSYYDAEEIVYAGLAVLESLGVDRDGLGGLRSENFSDSLRPVYHWAGGHAILDGLANPFTPTQDKYFYHGSQLYPNGDALVVAGYTPSPVGFNDAAILVANQGRTVFNGFNTDELGSSDALILLRNEIQFVLGIPEPSTFLLLLLPVALVFRRLR